MIAFHWGRRRLTPNIAVKSSNKLERIALPHFIMYQIVQALNRTNLCRSFKRQTDTARSRVPTKSPLPTKGDRKGRPYTPNPGNPPTIRTVSKLTVITDNSKSRIYRGLPCSRAQSFGSFRMPLSLSILT